MVNLMKQKMKEEIVMKLRKGFTLVELLIVIVIIGILAGAMLLASGAATASAEASNIVSNLRSLQSASLMLFADHMDALQGTATTVTIGGSVFDMLDSTTNGQAFRSLVGYTSNPQALVWNTYQFAILGDANALAGRAWWVGTSVARTDVGNRLQGRREGVQLYGTPFAIASNATAVATPDFISTNPNVWMLIRSPAAVN